MEIDDMQHVAEFKDGSVILDGMPLKAVSAYDIHHEHPKKTVLTVQMDVILKGQDDW